MKSEVYLNGDDLHFQQRCGGRKLAWLTALSMMMVLLGVIVGGCETNADFSKPTYASVDGLFPLRTNVLTQADVISITFRYSTNFNTVQKIGLDGMVNLEGAGEVKAAGKTIAQLQNELTDLYRSQVKDDPITVRNIAPAAAIYVTGAVSRPGKVAMDRRMTVLDAIAEAGGVDPYRAKLSKISVLRVDGDTQKIYWLNLNRMMSGEDDAPFYLEPFDVVHVPTKTFNF